MYIIVLYIIVQYISYLFLVDHIIETLLDTSADVDSLEPESILEGKWIKEIVKKSGMKYKWAKLVETKQRENKDIQKRRVGLESCTLFSK